MSPPHLEIKVFEGVRDAKRLPQAVAISLP